MREYEFHPFSERYPLMDGDAFDELVESIEDGYRNECPIWLYQGKILDGRNRYRACEQSGVVPLYEQFQGDDDDAKRFIHILNHVRRHLTVQQQKDLRLDRLEKVVTKRAEGKSTRQIAEELGTSHTTVLRDLDTAAVLDVSEVESQQEDISTGTSADECSSRNGPVVGADGKKRKGVSDKKKEAQQLVQRKGCQAVKDALRDKEITLAKAAALAKLPVNQQTATLEGLRDKKKPKDAAPPAVIVQFAADAEGNRVTDACKDAFVNLDKYKSIDSLCRQLQKEINEIVTLPGGEQLRRFVRPVGSEDKQVFKSEHLDALKRDLKATRPHAVCPYCVGEGTDECRGCNGTAWVTATVWKDADETIRKKLGA